MLLPTVLVALAAVLLIIPQFWIWNPPVDQVIKEEPVPEALVHTDAIMVLAYRNDRQLAGRELAEAGVSDNLVLSISDRVRRMQDPESLEEFPTGAWLETCDTNYGDYLTWCVEPHPNDTVGEATAFARLAKEQGWESVVVVTEPSHLWRAGMIFDRCFPGETYLWASSPVQSSARIFYRALYEGAAIYKDLLFKQGC